MLLGSAHGRIPSGSLRYPDDEWCQAVGSHGEDLQVQRLSDRMRIQANSDPSEPNYGQTSPVVPVQTSHYCVTASLFEMFSSSGTGDCCKHCISCTHGQTVRASQGSIGGVNGLSE